MDLRFNYELYTNFLTILFTALLVASLVMVVISRRQKKTSLFWSGSSLMCFFLVMANLLNQEAFRFDFFWVDFFGQGDNELTVTVNEYGVFLIGMIIAAVIMLLGIIIPLSKKFIFWMRNSAFEATIAQKNPTSDHEGSVLNDREPLKAHLRPPVRRVNVP